MFTGAHMNLPMMFELWYPSKLSAWVKKSIIPKSSTAGPVELTGRAKLILTAWILHATTPNQWQEAEKKACSETIMTLH